MGKYINIDMYMGWDRVLIKFLALSIEKTQNHRHLVPHLGFSTSFSKNKGAKTHWRSSWSWGWCRENPLWAWTVLWCHKIRKCSKKDRGGGTCWKNTGANLKGLLMAKTELKFSNSIVTEWVRFLLWLCPRHAGIPGPGIEPESQQWQCQILND